MRISEIPLLLLGTPAIWVSSVEAFHAALADNSAMLAVKEAEAMGHRYGVRGTPAWFVGDRLVSGLLPAQEFEHLAELATESNKSRANT